jgi:hypothetical protein
MIKPRDRVRIVDIGEKDDYYYKRYSLIGRIAIANTISISNKKYLSGSFKLEGGSYIFFTYVMVEPMLDIGVDTVDKTKSLFSKDT